jgi:hypothetical protein
MSENAPEILPLREIAVVAQSDRDADLALNAGEGMRYLRE